MKKIVSLILFSILLVSCGQIGLYEKQVPIPSQEWYYDSIPEFTFHIEDTTSQYNLFVVLRHTDRYKYNNIWIRIGSKAPGDSMKFQKLNLKLANDNKEWEGTGMNDIFEVRKMISPGPIYFQKPGDYTFSIEQIMRENPLEHILNVGFRVEKVD